MKRRCSCHPQCAFHWNDPGYQGRIKWADLNKAQIASERSSEVVNEQRKTGKDISTVYGLSNKVPMRVLDPRHFHVYSKARSNGKD